jgi:hypothetical protein
MHSTQLHALMQGNQACLQHTAGYSTSPIRSRTPTMVTATGHAALPSMHTTCLSLP